MSDNKDWQKHFKWVDQSFVTTPLEGQVQVILDSWWVTNAEGQVSIYKKYHPQCNQNPVVTDRFMSSVPGAVGRVQIPVAYVRADTAW